MSYERHGVSNYWQLDCLFNRFWYYIKQNIIAPRYWPFVQGIHRWPGEFPAQRTSNVENVSIAWRSIAWRHNGKHQTFCFLAELI